MTDHLPLLVPSDRKAQKDFAERRGAMMAHLHQNAGYTQLEIANVFGVSQNVVCYRLMKQREKDAMEIERPDVTGEELAQLYDAQLLKDKEDQKKENQRLTRETHDLCAILKGVALGDTPLVGPKIDVPRPLRPEHMRDPLGVVASVAEVRGLVMGVRFFKDLRYFGRHVMEIETLAVKLKAGLHGRLWDAPLFTTRPSDTPIWIVGQRKDGTWVRQEVGYDAELEKKRKPPFPGSIYAPPGVYC